METPFYMVYVEGSRGPNLRHPTRESAMKEAQRLSAQEIKTAWVLKTVGGYMSKPRTEALEIDVEEEI